MNIYGFRFWIKKNIFILDIFKQWFYPHIWESIYDSQNNLVSGYELMKPYLISKVNVKFES